MTVLTYSQGDRLAAEALMIELARKWAPRSMAREPLPGDTLVLEGTAVMVLGVVAGGFTGAEDRVRFRTRSGVWGIWEDEVSAAAWEALVENWPVLGAERVPAESVEQIYPHRERVRVGFTGGAETLGRFMAGFPAADRPARVSTIGGEA